MKAIGVYTLWVPNLLERFNCSLEEFKTSQIQWGKVYLGQTETTEEDDLINELLNANNTTIEDYNNETGIVRLQFNNSVPIEIIRQKFEYFIPLFEEST